MTFDLDDTLWLCAPVIQNAEFVFYTWLVQHYPAISARYDIDALVFHRREVFAMYPDQAHDFSWLRRRWLERLARDFGADDRLVEEGFRVYHTARNDITLLPGAHNTLQLASSIYQCGTITNGNADIEMVGIGRYFDFSVTAASAGASKPSPAIFESAVEQSGRQPGQILHIGDDPDRDVRGAAAVGMRTVWINPQGNQWHGDDPPDFELHLVSELPRLIAAHAPTVEPGQRHGT